MRGTADDEAASLCHRFVVCALFLREDLTLGDAHLAQTQHLAVLHAVAARSAAGRPLTHDPSEKVVDRSDWCHARGRFCFLWTRNHYLEPQEVLRTRMLQNTQSMIVEVHVHVSH